MLYYSQQKGQPDVLRHGEEDSGRSGNKTKRVEHEIMSLCKRGRSVERPAVRIPGADEHSVVHRCSGTGSRHARTNPVLGRGVKNVRFALDQALLRNTRGFVDVRSAMTLVLLIVLIRGLVGRGRAAFNPLSVIWWLFQAVDH